MLIEILSRVIIAFGLYYYLESRFLYAYEIKGECPIPFVIDVNKVIKNNLCRIIFPKEFRTPQETLDGISKISIIGLLHCIFFYFPLQIANSITAVYCFVNQQIASKIFATSFKIMFLGNGVFLLLEVLVILINKIRMAYFTNGRKRK